LILFLWSGGTGTLVLFLSRRHNIY